MTNTHKAQVQELPLLVTAGRPDDKRHPGLWEFPGGKIEPGESPKDALCREIREELDVEIRIVDVLEVVFYRYDWGPVLILAYRCQLLTRNIRDIGVAEHRWVQPEELTNFPILPADQPIIDRLSR
jgi:8-oxo-dGTP diphosphatase